MTDEQVKSTARAINQYWWHDDTDLLDFTRAVLARARMADEALLRQALEALEWVEPSGTIGHGGIKARNQSIAAIKERLK